MEEEKNEPAETEDAVFKKIVSKPYVTDFLINLIKYLNSLSFKNPKLFYCLLKKKKNIQYNEI